MFQVKENISCKEFQLFDGYISELLPLTIQ